MPNYLLTRGEGKAVLRNYEGVITTYTEPVHTTPAPVAKPEPSSKVYKAKDGVALLLSGEKLCLEPGDLSRKKRKHH
jgi:lysine 2,3-aminomutase